MKNSDTETMSGWEWRTLALRSRAEYARGWQYAKLKPQRGPWEKRSCEYNRENQLQTKQESGGLEGEMQEK